MASNSDANTFSEVMVTSDGMAPATTWQPTVAKKRSHLLPKVLLVCILALYGAGVWFFNDHFTPGTTVDGIDASFMTPHELEDALQNRASSYTQRITGGDGFEMSIAAGDVDLTIDCTNVADEARAQSNPALWFAYLVAPQNMLIDSNVQLNEDKLTEQIDAAITAYDNEAKACVNATGAYDTEAKKFKVVKETEGTQLLTKAAVKASLTASRELREEVTLGDNAYIKPSITSDDKKLKASIKEANKILKAAPIEIVAGEEVIETIDADTVASFISFDDESNVVIDGVYSWIENNETVIDAGNKSDDENVWAIDLQGTCDEVHRVMEKDRDDQAQVVREVIETKPAVTEGAKERGRHLDVNLTTQYVRFYDTDGTVIWESYCVTGGYDTQFGDVHNTPTGEFAIEGKETNRTLVGADRDGDNQPDYESFVYYWMPFLAGDWGFHDATWRGEFGPGIRDYWGSHGCINLPYDAAEQLFNLVVVGDPVYIHY